MTGPSLDLDALREKEAIYQALEWRMDRLRTAASGYEMACDIGERVSECRRHFELECSPTTILDVLSLVDDLRAENERLREALTYVGEFARAHHHQQPAHVLLHGLTIDIPEFVERALAGSPAANEEQQCPACRGSGFHKRMLGRQIVHTPCDKCTGTGKA